MCWQLADGAVILIKENCKSLMTDHSVLITVDCLMGFGLRVEAQAQ